MCHAQHLAGRASIVCQLVQQCCCSRLVVFIQCSIHFVEQQQPAAAAAGAGNSQKHGEGHECALTTRELPQVGVPAIILAVMIAIFISIMNSSATHTAAGRSARQYELCCCRCILQAAEPAGVSIGMVRQQYLGSNAAR